MAILVAQYTFYLVLYAIVGQIVAFALSPDYESPQDGEVIVFWPVVVAFWAVWCVVALVSLPLVAARWYHARG